jgi:tetratricopeptide (TPR) repeat protein
MRRAVWLTAAAAVGGAAVLAGAVGLTLWARRPDVSARLPAPPTGSGRTPAVIAHLRDRHAAALRDQSAASVGELCRAYHADMAFDQAVRCYDLLGELDPDAWRWRYDRALIDADRGGSPALAGELRQVTAAAPGFGPAWLRLGDAEFKAGRYDAAAAAWRRASAVGDPPAKGDGPPEGGPYSPAHIVEVPLAVHASLGLARIALVRGDAGTAQGILEDLAVKAPGFSPVHRLLADAYRAAGREADAVRVIGRANRLPPYAPYADPAVDTLARESRNSTLLLRLASEATLTINGGWSEFLTRRAAEFDPDNPDVIVKLARILRTLQRNEEALQYFERYRQMVPGDFEGLAHIGSTLSALGRFEEAEPYLRRALAGEDDPQTHYNLGLLLVVTGRAAEGVREYERALALDPAHADARLNLANALARQGQVERAARQLETLVAGDPEHAVARTNLAVLRLQQGRRDDAIALLREALRIDPHLAPAAELLASVE